MCKCVIDRKILPHNEKVNKLHASHCRLEKKISECHCPVLRSTAEKHFYNPLLDSHL